MFFYVSRLWGGVCIDTWFSLWIILELNTITFISLLMYLNNFNFIDKTICYFIIQTLRSLILILSFRFTLYTGFKILFIVLGFFSILLKIGFAPFHIWIVSISFQISWASLFFIVTLQKIIPLIFLEIWLPSFTPIALLFILLSCCVGSVLNFNRNRLKTFIVNSRITRIGWILMAINLSFNIWKFYFLIYIANLLFLILEKNKNTKNTKNIVIFLTFLRIRGVPPLIGFFPKLLILTKILNIKIFFLTYAVIFFRMLEIFILTKITNTPSFTSTSNNKWKSVEISPALIGFLVLNRGMFFIVF